ncbi:PrsW family intramembrane metalloprotease [Candidatus Peregrinibacteria bacterium]|nr:PrsW family intramembrane metalloprotease [Candidatus Peregrinibacteria bacterium]
MINFEPLYLIYGGLAFVPAIIWLALLFKKTSNKKIQLLIFLFGSFSVIPIFLIQYLFNQFPQTDFVTLLDSKISNPTIHFLLIYSWVSITEEIIKQWVIRYLDTKFLLVQTINDSIQLSLISALGFSFAENIFYFYHIGTSLGLASLLVAYIFRSLFTTCAHLVFSGFFGYFYGIAKFSISIVEQSNLQGKKMYLSKIIGKVLNISKIQAYQEATILKGLFFAIIMHTFFNYNLEMNSNTGNSIYLIIAIIFIIISYLALRVILKNRAGKLILVEGAVDQKTSSMAKTDEEVVIELLGMWFNKGKFVDVIHICERLLTRDPDNKIVQLFKAKALDKMDQSNPYKNILNKLFPEEIDKK